MGSYKRREERYSDIGRVESTELCPLAGTLDNISLNGCKVIYKFPVVVDLENDYNLKITFARNASKGSLLLVCHPCWVRETNGCTEIGFQILPSADSARLAEYVKKLSLEKNGEEIFEEIDNSACELI